MKENFKLIAIVCFLVFILIAMPSFQIIGSEIEREQEDKVFLTIWHVDSFEGGQNSRKTFLNSTAIAFQKENPNVYVVIKELTVTGYLDLLKKGGLPDLLSFGTGVSRASLPYLTTYNGCNNVDNVFLDVGKVDGECYAVPWAYSGYFLIGEGKQLIYGKSDESNPLTALYSYMKNGNELGFNTYNLKENLQTTKQAYSSWTLGDDCLLGVNRDVVRMENYINNGRLKEQKVLPITTYADLFCMIGICKDSENYQTCVNFIEYLTTDDVQKGIANLKLFSPVTKIYDSGFMQEYENNVDNLIARNVFTPCNEWEESVAISSIKGDNDSRLRIDEVLEND